MKSIDAGLWIATVLKEDGTIAIHDEDSEVPYTPEGLTNVNIMIP